MYVFKFHVLLILLRLISVTLANSSSKYFLENTYLQSSVIWPTATVLNVISMQMLFESFSYSLLYFLLLSFPSSLSLLSQFTSCLVDSWTNSTWTDLSSFWDPLFFLASLLLIIVPLFLLDIQDQYFSHLGFFHGLLPTASSQ